jgi:D-alanyl-D-alanine dipeptidase
MLELRDADALGWCGRVWRRVARPEEPVPPPDLAPHLGSYGPACLDSRLLWAGRLVCVMEQFFPHECMPLGGHRYRLGPGMYEDEIVELGVRAAAGRPAIRVGDMLLARG